MTTDLNHAPGPVFALPPAGELPREPDRAAFDSIAGKAADPVSHALALDLYKLLLERREPAPRPAAIPLFVYRLAAGAVAAAVAFTLVLWRRFGQPRGRPVWIVLHGPHETRSRHVMDLAAEAAPEKAAVLVVGRRDAAGVHRALMGRNPRLQVLRPVSLVSLIGAVRQLPAILTTLGVIEQSLSEAGSAAIGFRNSAALCFRAVAGLAHAGWVARAPAAPHAIILGHTGTAETTLLEHAARARGVPTVHLLHGKCDGPMNFGVSDVAVCRSRFDARMLAGFGGYGDAVALRPPAASPALPRQPLEWIVCSNLAHPTGAAHAAQGIDAEIGFIRLVAEARRRSAVPGRFLFRLHPAISGLSASERSAVTDALDEHDFVPDEGGEIGQAVSGRVVLTTPSTVFMDAIGLGAPTLVYEEKHTSPGTFVPSVPEELRFADCTTLAARLRTLATDPAALDAALREARAEFAAAAPESLDEVLRAAGLAPPPPGPGGASEL